MKKKIKLHLLKDVAGHMLAEQEANLPKSNDRTSTDNLMAAGSVVKTSCLGSYDITMLENLFFSRSMLEYCYMLVVSSRCPSDVLWAVSQTCPLPKELKTAQYMVDLRGECSPVKYNSDMYYAWLCNNSRHMPMNQSLIANYPELESARRSYKGWDLLGQDCTEEAWKFLSEAWNVYSRVSWDVLEIVPELQGVS